MKFNFKNSNILYLTIIALVAFVFYIRYYQGRAFGDIVGLWGMTTWMMKDAIYTYGTFAFWQPYISGGAQLISIGEIAFLDPSFFITMLFPGMSQASVTASIMFSLFIHLIILAFGSYFLVKHLENDNKTAFIAAILTMLGGYAFLVATQGIPPRLYGYAYLPFVFLFTIKALKEEKYKNSILAGLSLGLIILSGSAQSFLWISVAFGLYLAFHVATSAFAPSQIKKVIVVGLIVVIVTLGISAVKTIPGQEFIENSNRAQGVSYDEYVWEFSKISISKVPAGLVFGKAAEEKVKIGLLGTLLLLLGFSRIKRKYVLFFTLLAIFSIMIAIQTPLTKLFYDLYPGMDKTRDVSFVLLLFGFSAAIIAASGSKKAIVYLSKLVKSKRNAALIIGILIAIELLAFSNIVPQGPANIDEKLEKTLPLQAIKDEEGIFRMHYYKNNQVGGFGAHFATSLGLQTIDWSSGNVWYNEYLQYMLAGGQYIGQAPKMWGLLNVKYVVARSAVDNQYLELVDEYEPCDICDHQFTHLYINKEYLPRAYTSANPVLVFADDAQYAQFFYTSILNSIANPKTTSLIQANKALSEYSQEELKYYKSIVLIGTAADNSQLAKLSEYKNSGGVILPDITAGVANIDINAISEEFSKYNTTHLEAQIVEYEPNKVIVKPSQTGVLVLAEKYSLIDNWQSSQGEILKANGVSSAVITSQEVTFEYNPKEFILGFMITLVTIAAIILFFISRTKYFSTFLKKQ